MGILLRKHHGEFTFTGIAKLSVVGFLVALSTAVITAIWAVYLDSFVDNVAIVGFISALLTILGVASYFISIPIIERSSKSKLFTYSLLIFGITYVIFSLINSLLLVILAAVLMTATYAIRVTTYGLMVKDKSKKTQLARNEGLRFTFVNIAWVVGPLIAGLLSARAGIKSVFILGAIFIFLAFIFTKLSGVKDDRISKKIDEDIIKNFFDFLKNKDRLIAYIVGGGVSFWWGFIYLFMPLYIVRNGLSEIWIGYFLFSIAVPLIILEYRFSKIAGRKGFRKIFMLGYLIPAIMAISAFFIADIFIIMVLLVIASIGLAMLEPTTEAYFFDISTKRDQQRFYGPFNTRIEFIGLVGKVLASTMLLILPFRTIFLFYGIAMFCFFLLSIYTKNVREKK